MKETQRRLSPWRVMIAILILAGITFGTMYSWQWWKDMQSSNAYKPWFAAYVDVTSTPTYAFEQLGATKNRNVVLSFIVSSQSDSCTPTWGGYYTLDEASAKLDLDRRIARLRQLDGSIAISFGGLLNDELAVKCTDADKLLKAYESVINRYAIDTIDLDLENNGLTNNEAGKRRAKVIAQLQTKRRSEGKILSVWLTLPVAPQGLTEDGTNAVSQILVNKVDIAGVNGMIMDYSTSREEGDSMRQASEKALTQTHRQLGILYRKVGINLSGSALWRKIGATPMIGQNDIVSEIFTLEDAKGINQFAHVQGIGRISMWSANRDVQCGDNYVDLEVVSNSCSGVKQDKLSFAEKLSNGFDGKLKNNQITITKKDLETKTQKPDDPAKSPYQIWKKSGAYLKGTKVVWHRNVYEAKWWTQGDMPDNPVLQSWETPWQLVGPVLPGEKPIKQPTLPEGTYPKWSGTVEYETSQRVLFNGVPYQAKWWTQGDSPAAASSNPDSSPWSPLTQEQIKEIIEGKE